MKCKGFGKSVSVLFVLALLAAVLSSDAAARPKKLKLATLAPKGTLYYNYLLEMKQKWREAPGGGAKLIIYPDGQMGSEADVVRRMRVNQIQVAMMTATGLIEIDESIAALQNMPLMFRDLKEAKYVRDKLRPMIEENFKNKGFKLLFLEDAGWICFFSTKPAV
ncbi:MAG: TRAP transporter substrate-binding protein DctP, partial [Planctomycetota bacterium]